MNNNVGCLGFILRLFGISVKPAEPEKLPYKARYLLTKAEFSFYKVLLQASGDQLLVFPKVSVKDILSVTSGDKQERSKYFNKISQKHVDFLVCNAETLDLVCAIELDDSSHDGYKRKARDEFLDKAFASAGVRLERVVCKKSYSVDGLRQVIYYPGL